MKLMKPRSRPFFLLFFIHIVISDLVSAIATHQEKRGSMDKTGTMTEQLYAHGVSSESLQFLYAHNIVRQAKSEPPLTWDYELERYARWWAGQRKPDCELVHSFPEGGFQLGENIFWGGGSGWTAGDAVKLWADEEQYYDYWSNSCEYGQECGHYTQIVWRDTRRLGCARVVCHNGDIFITCNYYPPGNYVGNRPY